MSETPEENAPEVEEEKGPQEKRPKPEELTVYYVDGFIVQFTALVMILLALFILLNALATLNESKKRKAIGSLLGSFGVLPSGVGTDKQGQFTAEVEMISLSDESSLFAPFEAFARELELDEKDVEFLIDDEGRRRIRFGESVLFRTGSHLFHPRIIPLLDRLAAMLRLLDRPIEIEGHTDGQGSPAANWRLSARRAQSVVRFLEEAGNIKNSLLAAVGYGATRPIQVSGDEDVMRRNRRVEVVVY